MSFSAADFSIHFLFFLGFACSQRDFWLYCRASRPRKTPSIFPTRPLYFYFFPPCILKANRFIVFFALFFFFFLPDFTLRAWRTLTLLRAITCYWSPPTVHSICLTFKPFDTHIVAANVQVRMCWLKRFFLFGKLIHCLLITRIYLQIKLFICHDTFFK